MPQFEITVRDARVVTLQIVAGDQLEAQGIVQDRIKDGDIEFQFPLSFDWEIYDVEQIEEDDDRYASI